MRSSRTSSVTPWSPKTSACSASTPTDYACSLSATELRVRLAEMAALGHAALVDARHDATHAELRFAAGAGVRERVEAIVATESHCCAFLPMRLTGEPDAVVLTIDAPEGAELVLTELLDAFRGQPQAA